jgi:hypothetical protein
MARRQACTANPLLFKPDALPREKKNGLIVHPQHSVRNWQ